MENRILNLGIMAHVDAGKTTLTESLLYYSGIVKVRGSVDKGTTITDSLELEQKRGGRTLPAGIGWGDSCNIGKRGRAAADPYPFPPAEKNADAGPVFYQKN